MSTVDVSSPFSPFSPFTVSVVPDGDEVAVVPVGELDLASVDAVGQAVAGLTAAGSDRIVVDLGQVDFIDSTGLRVLLSLRNDAQRNGHALTLLQPRPSVGRIFDITGTRGVFNWREPPAS